MTIAAGTKLGRYEVRAKIGAGGMGEVYLAQDTKLDRTVAVKVLPTDLASDQNRRLKKSMVCISSLWNTSTVKRCASECRAAGWI